jgi:uncharacterized membrane protein YccF (DUF307 family)
MINVVLNILWLILGGLCMALGWFVAGVIMIITIVGIPWARAAFNMGIFALWPFGRTVVARDDYTGHEDIGTGPLGVIGNIVWLLLAGIWLAIGHIVIAFGLALTIIGIPFAWQNLKFVGLAIWPIGRAVVDREDALGSPLAVLEPSRKLDE